MSVFLWCTFFNEKRYLDDYNWYGRLSGGLESSWNEIASFHLWYNPDLATLMARQTWISWILCHKFRWLISQHRPLNKWSLMAALCCIYTGWLDVIQPKKWIAHTAVCSAQQHQEGNWLQTSDTLHQTHCLVFTNFIAVLSSEDTFKLIWTATHKMSEAHMYEDQRLVRRFVIMLAMFSTYLSTGNIGQVGEWECNCWFIPRPLLWSPHRLWFCRFDCGLLYSPHVVYCGPEPTLGPLPLQLRLPEKLLWWNVRQAKGRWGQTEKLFSLSLCFTLLTSVQNSHLAVITRMREEVKENESVFMHVCVCFHV